MDNKEHQSPSFLDKTLVDRFSEDLRESAETRILELPDLVNQVSHFGKWQSVSSAIQNGFYSSDNFEYSEVDFSLRPTKRLGREDSHNQVFFGHISTADKQISKEVAVKKTSNDSLLLGEIAMSQYIDSLGLKTFKPVGIVKTEPRQYLLTEFRGEVGTMDTIEWQDINDEERWEQLDFALNTLKTLHENMLFHGDLFFRNIAFGDRGELEIVDPEHMVSLRGVANMLACGSVDDSSSLEPIKRAMARDLWAVRSSVDNFVIASMPKRLRPRDKETSLKVFKKNFLDKYRDQIDRDAKFGAVLINAYDLCLNDFKSRARELS